MLIIPACDTGMGVVQSKRVSQNTPSSTCSKQLPQSRKSGTIGMDTNRNEIVEKFSGIKLKTRIMASTVVADKLERTKFFKIPSIQ